MIDPVIEQLRAIRIGKGLTQTDVAKRIWTHRGVVNHFERGRRSPTLATLQRYAEAVGAKITVEVE